MELKKNPGADLEKKKNLYFFTGLLIALAVVLVAFEWKVYDITLSELGQLQVDLEEEEMIPITRQELTPPPPPPPKPTQIEIVDDEKEVDEDITIDTESNEETVIQMVEVKEEVVQEPQIFTIVEEMPGFPGGDEELFKYLGKSIKYPAMAKDANIQGTVYVTFVVKEDGSISNVQILRGIGGGCDEEAKRVVESMPKWKPGKQRGKAVRVQFNLPIKFILR